MPNEAADARPVARPNTAWPAWAALGGILLLGLALRVLYFREVVEKPDFAAPAIDAGFHDYWARGLASGDWTPPYGHRDPGIRETPFLRPPGYPYFLSLVYRVVGLSYVGPRIVQMGLGLLNCVLAFLFARRWYGSGVGLLLAALLNLYWVLIYFEGELHADTLMITLLWAALLVLSRWGESPAFRWALAAGLLIGLAALVRPNVLLFAPAVLLWSGWIARRRRSARRFCLSGAGFVVGLLAAVAPATVRNYLVAGDLVLISSNAGINLFIGNNPDATGRVADHIAGLGPFRHCYDYPGLIEALEQRQGRKLRASEVSAYFTAQALGWMKEHPLDFLRVTARKAYLFWGPAEIAHNKVIRCERQYSNVLRKLPLNFSFALGACIAGIILLFGAVRRSGSESSPAGTAPPGQWEVSVLLILLILAQFLSIVPFFVAARYRVPTVPFLLLFAAYGLYRLGRLALARRQLGTVLLSAAWIALSGLAGRPAPLSAAERATWHWARGQAYFRIEQNDAAVAELTRAVLLDASDADMGLDLAVALAHQRRTDEALARWRAVQRADPTHPRLRRVLAVIQHEAQRSGDEQQ